MPSSFTPKVLLSGIRKRLSGCKDQYQATNVTIAEPSGVPECQLRNAGVGPGDSPKYLRPAEHRRETHVNYKHKTHRMITIGILLEVDLILT
ncbi:hypothetical protein J6590_028677 [Homalodisca vitripennis]|nr:hypothetical protein J6590_028677 [Homalodisca vitripennis]